MKRLVAAGFLAVALLVVYYLMSGKGFGMDSNWGFVLLNVGFFGLFVLFMPFKRKVSRRSSSIYIAFIVGLYAEMYGVPLTMYFFSWAFGASNLYTLEFLLSGVLGQELFYTTFTYFIFPATALLMIAGILLIVFGWKEIYKGQATNQLVTSGIYSRIRHPQYLGFMLLTLGMNLEWTTLFTLLMWPLLVVMYYRLGKEEDAENFERFGDAFQEYKQNVPSLIPHLHPTPLQTPTPPPKHAT
ncbi:MAG: isoprenylcysteine carboxylmethyltransferase family protein [Candidatus Bathyarchaeota archaeon]|nr:isoprenylcysteine carboxylmethyltransferase family protein [Candidatus Bathyarchaeota archaeon]